MDEIRSKGGLLGAQLHHVKSNTVTKVTRQNSMDDDDDITKALMKGLEVKMTALIVFWYPVKLFKTVQSLEIPNF